jgi:hypothetical protein
VQAFEVSGALSTNRDIGVAVCKFTPGKLLPVMTKILTILSNQSPKTLANLPAFTELLGNTRPEVFSVSETADIGSSSRSVSLYEQQWLDVEWQMLRQQQLAFEATCCSTNECASAHL